MNNRKFKAWLKRHKYSAELFNPGDSDRIQKILNGESELVMQAITWVHMPQKHPYFWESLYRRQRTMSKRTRLFLSKLRDEAKRRGC
jgi:hypothetical protein